MYLENLTILNGENTLEFDSLNTLYTINVESTVEFLELEYVASSEDVIVEVIGNENFVEGQNIVYINLSLEDELTQYKLIVNKEEVFTVFTEVNIEDYTSSPTILFEGYSVISLIMFCAFFIIVLFKFLVIDELKKH